MFVYTLRLLPVNRAEKISIRYKDHYYYLPTFDIVPRSIENNPDRAFLPLKLGAGKVIFL